MAPPVQHCYLVKRIDDGHGLEDGDGTVTIGCYTTLQEANKHARAEVAYMHFLYDDEAFAIEHVEDDDTDSKCYTAEMEMMFEDEYVVSVEVTELKLKTEYNAKDSGHVTEEGQDEQDSNTSDPLHNSFLETGSSENSEDHMDAAIQDLESVTYSTQLQLPEFLPDCLAGQSFAIAGSEPTVGYHTLRNLLVDCGADVLEAVRLREHIRTQGAMTIVEGPQVVDSIAFLLKRITYHITRMSTPGLFLMIQTLSGTVPILRPDSESLEDTQTKEAVSGKRRGSRDEDREDDGRNQGELSRHGKRQRREDSPMTFDGALLESSLGSDAKFT